MTTENEQDASMYTYEFPIGDWSKDGHGQSEMFTVHSPALIDDIVKVHNSCSRVLGFSIGSICSQYEESTIAPEILDILKAKGIWDKFKIKINDDIFFEENDLEDGFWIQEPEFLLELWIMILNFLDPDLNLAYYKDIKLQSLRYRVKAPGYGLFSL